MKKLISTLLAISMVVVPLSSTVSASGAIIGPGIFVPVNDELENTSPSAENANNLDVPTIEAPLAEQTEQVPTVETPEQAVLYTPLNSNFKKQATFSEEEVDLDALGIADWCREDFIHLYELGFTELADSDYDLYGCCDYNLITETFYKFLKMYNGESIELVSVENYLKEQGILLDEERIWYIYAPDHPSVPLAKSFFKGNSYSSSNAYYRHSVQVLITRLLNKVDIGEPINSLTSITDISASDSDKINLDDVLELYNLGLFAGDSRGRFNAYDYMSLSEFVTVMARICFPNRRVKINEQEYYAKANTPVEIIQTYNSIDDYWFNRIKDLTHLSSLYVETPSDDRIISIGEALYILRFIFKNNLSSNTLQFAPGSEECYEIYTGSARQLLGYNVRVNWLTPSSQSDSIANDDSIAIRQNISKKDLVLLFMSIAEGFFGVYSQTKVTLNPNVTADLTEEQLHLFTSAVSLGLIENTVEDFTQSSITQAEFEKMIVQFAMKFSTVIKQNATRKGNERINLVTNYSLLPSNYELFPYIADLLPKEVYEALDLSVSDFGYHSEEEYIEHYGTPKSKYNIQSVDYRYSDEKITGYFDVILNVDYRTITAESFAKALNEYYCWQNTPFELTAENEIIKNYVEYVKKNKIILSGKGTPDLSYVYTFDNLMMSTNVVACKIEVNVINSEIETPKLFMLVLNDTYFPDANNPSVKYVRIPISYVPITYSQQGVFKISSFPNITE